MWAVLDYTNTRCVERELLLAKVSTLGPEFASNHSSDSLTSQAAYDSAIDQTATAPSFVSSDGSSGSENEAVEREQALARSFENSSSGNPLYPSRKSTEGMSASEALIAKNLHFTAIKTLAEQFGGRIVDVGENDCIVQLTAKSVRVNAFLNLMRTFGVLEASRSGASSRCPVDQSKEDAHDIQVSWFYPEAPSLTTWRKRRSPRGPRSISRSYPQDKRCRLKNGARCLFCAMTQMTIQKKHVYA